VYDVVVYLEVIHVFVFSLCWIFLTLLLWISTYACWG